MNQPPFHNPNSNPLADANDVEREFRGPKEPWQEGYRSELDEVDRARFESDKRRMRNFIIGLLVLGLTVGGLLSVGLIWGLHRLDMINPPALHESR
jgi:hypothetical protein